MTFDENSISIDLKALPKFFKYVSLCLRVVLWMNDPLAHGLRTMIMIWFQMCFFHLAALLLSLSCYWFLLFCIFYWPFFSDFKDICVDLISINIIPHQGYLRHLKCSRNEGIIHISGTTIKSRFQTCPWSPSSREGVLILTLGHCTQSSENMEFVYFFMLHHVWHKRNASSKTLF